MTVTAAITTYNRAPLLIEALESILAQSIAPTEIIVVDNGSTDDTHARLTPYIDRIDYIYKKEIGRACARNAAIARASGEYIAFLDSDDAWLPDKLERQLAVLARHPSAALMHGHVEVIDERSEPLPALTERHRAYAEHAHRNGVSYATYCLECRCLTSTTLMRLDTLRKLGGYDTSLAIEDLDLYLRLALDHEIVFMHGEPLARYRSHSGQTSHEEHDHGQIAVAQRHLAFLADGASPPDARRARSNLNLTIALCHHRLAENADARRFALCAVRIDLWALTRGAVRPLALSVVPRRLKVRLRKLRRTRVAE